MTESTGSVPLSRPQADMLSHVEALLRRHPRLVATWEAGWALELGCDTDAIWARALPSPPADPLEARMETPRWWLPSRSGRALAIAEALATQLEQEIAPRG